MLGRIKQKRLRPVRAGRYVWCVLGRNGIFQPVAAQVLAVKNDKVQLKCGADIFWMPQNVHGYWLSKSSAWAAIQHHNVWWFITGEAV